MATGRAPGGKPRDTWQPGLRVETPPRQRPTLHYPRGSRRGRRGRPRARRAVGLGSRSPEARLGCGAFRTAATRRAAWRRDARGVARRGRRGALAHAPAPEQVVVPGLRRGCAPSPPWGAEVAGGGLEAGGGGGGDAAHPCAPLSRRRIAGGAIFPSVSLAATMPPAAGENEGGRAVFPSTEGASYHTEWRHAAQTRRAHGRRRPNPLRVLPTIPLEVHPTGSPTEDGRTETMPGAATTAFRMRRKTTPRLPELRRSRRKTTRAGNRPEAGRRAGGQRPPGGRPAAPRRAAPRRAAPRRHVTKR